MLIVDGHLDLAMNALKENRDLLVNVWTTRVRESHDTAKGKGKSTVSLEEMRRGRVALCFTTAHAFATTGRFIPHMTSGLPNRPSPSREANWPTTKLWNARDTPGSSVRPNPSTIT